ncbi:MAG: Gfo/Idh/MocA family oxidoreductase [Chloroflexota bacterium]|nr:Gfo/Idh/MocA family oxidoreductase [Chloroflexota bacterium]
MRVALVGAGRIGRLHGRLLAAQGDVAEVTVADVDPARAKASADAIGARLAATVEEAFDSSDAVVIAASTNAHAALVSMAIDRELPTFVEKPLAFDLAETETLVERIEHAGIRVQVGFQRRFDPAYVEARRIVETGELGTVYLVRLVAHDHEPPPDDYIPTSGGLFRDSSIHDFDALRWVTGQEVEEVYAAGSVRGFPVFAEHDDVDTGAVILEMGDGTLAVLGQTRHDPRGYDIRMEIIGSKDAITVGLTPRTPLRSVDADGLAMPGPAWTSFLTRFEVAYQAELLAFLRVARGEMASPCTARDALEAMRISVAASCSRSERKPVRLRDIGSRPRSPDREQGPREEVSGAG